MVPIVVMSIVGGARQEGMTGARAGGTTRLPRVRELSQDLGGRGAWRDVRHMEPVARVVGVAHRNEP